MIAKAQVEVRNFGGHYVEWRANRVAAITRLFGTQLEGRTVLELACGYGEIGSELQALGADVTYSEGREEHVAILRERFGGERVERLDLEDGVQLRKPKIFDLVLHLGVLYHLSDPWPSIRDSAKLGRTILLESECLPRIGVARVQQEEEGYDQALHGSSLRLSPEAIEELLSNAGLSFARLRSPLLDTGFHTYSGRLMTNGESTVGFRRMWLAYPTGSEVTVTKLLTIPHLFEVPAS